MTKDELRNIRQNDACNNRDMPVDKEILNYLFDIATDLAIMHFCDPTHDHVVGIFDRLALNHAWGLGSEGTVTVH